MLWIIIIVFVAVVVNNAGVVHSFHPIYRQCQGGGGAVDRRVVSLTIPTQRSAARKVSSTTTTSRHVMTNDHSVRRREGGRRGFVSPPHVFTTRRRHGENNNNGVVLTAIRSNNNDSENNDSNDINDGGGDKFSSFHQRIESIKTAILGGVVGSICSTPFIAIHDLLLDGTTGGGGTGGSIANWEFDTDASAVQGALFAIVYRYCIRASDPPNNMLNMGVIGAFVLVPTTSRIQLPTYCTALPLTCGPPLGFVDYTILFALLVNSIEGLALFGSVAYMMEYAYNKQWISKFT